MYWLIYGVGVVAQEAALEEVLGEEAGAGPVKG